MIYFHPVNLRDRKVQQSEHKDGCVAHALPENVHHRATSIHLPHIALENSERDRKADQQRQDRCDSCIDELHKQLHAILVNTRNGSSQTIRICAVRGWDMMMGLKPRDASCDRRKVSLCFHARIVVVIQDFHCLSRPKKPPDAPKGTTADGPLWWAWAPKSKNSHPLRQ